MGKPHPSKRGNTEFYGFDSNGREICKRVNDSRGCSFDEKCVFRHVCDKDTGKICGTKELHVARPRSPPKVILRGLSSKDGPVSALPKQLSRSACRRRLSFTHRRVRNASPHQALGSFSGLNSLSPFDFDRRRTNSWKIVYICASPRHTRIQNWGCTLVDECQLTLWEHTLHETHNLDLLLILRKLETSVSL